MDRTERDRADGFGGRSPASDSSSFSSDPYGPRSLGATTDAGAAATDDFFDRPYRNEPVETPVQMTSSGEAAETGAGVHAAAAHGVATGGGPLPHGDRIQAAFGPSHDVSHVQAHVGGAAAEASSAMGATAYATGDHVAFASTPDLHTAAHEAAHVVQQRAGVALKGGVGASGDPYERHADAVADAVVAGQSAAPILDQMAGTGGGTGLQQRAVQALHGDLNAAVLPEIAAQSPGMAGKTVGEAASGLGARDANFNPARKVELEVKLSAAILKNPGPAAGVVHEISRRMLAYFDAKVAAGLADADADLRALGKHFAGPNEKPNTVFFGRLADTIRDLRGDVAARMRALLQGGGTLTQQIFAHHQFIDQIWDKKGGGDYATGMVDRLRKLAEDAGQSFNQQLDPTAPKAFRKDESGAERIEFAERGRFAPDDRESRVKDTFGESKVPTTGTAAGIAARDDLGGGRQSAGLGGVAGNGLDAEHGGEQAHQRGVDRLTMDESNAFIQKARLLLDMPLAGGISGTTTDLMEVATTFGIAGPELHLYAVAVFGHLGSAGAHSFHEIAKAASFAGIPYQEGNYASFIPAAYMPYVQHLFDEYADVVNTAGAGGGGAEHAA